VVDEAASLEVEAAAGACLLSPLLSPLLFPRSNQRPATNTKEEAASRHQEEAARPPGGSCEPPGLAKLPT